jgi:site-specific recombinase XerD
MLTMLIRRESVGLRDRALLLIGFAGAFRRSELVSLNIEDLEESELGLTVAASTKKTSCRRSTTRLRR